MYAIYQRQDVTPAVGMQPVYKWQRVKGERFPDLRSAYIRRSEIAYAKPRLVLSIRKVVK